MKKLLIILLLLIPLVLGYADIVDSTKLYNSKHPVNVFNITQCDGPIRIKLSSNNPIDYSRTSISNCSYNANTTFWHCHCAKDVGKFNVVLQAPAGTYKLVLEYYLQWIDYDPSGTREPSYSEIRNNDWKFQRSVTGLTLTNIFSLPKIYISKFGNYILLSIMLIVAVIIGLLIYKLKDYAKPLFNKDDDNVKDIFNYQKFDKDDKDVKEDDDDQQLINDILNTIK